MLLQKKSYGESCRRLRYRILLLCTLLFAALPLHSGTDSISIDLDHLLGRSYYIIRQDVDKTRIIIFPRLTVGITGKVSVENYNSETVSFIKHQLEKKYNTTVIIENPGYVPPYMIDEAVRKKQMKTLLLSSLFGTIMIFACFIVYRCIKLKKTVPVRK